MNVIHPLKEALMMLCKKHIDQRFENIGSRISAIVEARNNETKSSAGDKHETGRTMMQIEEDKNYAQLAEIKKLRSQLSQISILKNETNKVGLGSLVGADTGIYFIAIGIGKVILNGITYYCISPNAPVAKLLLNKMVAEHVSFNGKRITIDRIE